MIALLLAAAVELTNAPADVAQADVDALWEFTELLVGATVEPPPVVYFAAEDEPAPSDFFLAFYYSHTNVLRVEPRHYALRGGLALVYIGHEMQHYAAERGKGIPVARHHCYFAEQSYWAKTTAWLIGRGALRTSLYDTRQHLDHEPNACDADIKKE